MKLLQALAMLDPEVDDHWTADGLPRMDALSALAGGESFTRRQVTEAAPDLTRSTAMPPTHRPATVEDLEAAQASSDADPADENFDHEGLEDDDEEDVEETEDDQEEDVEEFAPTPAPVLCVLDLPRHEVEASHDLVVQAIEELGKRSKALEAQRAQAERDLRQTAAKIEYLERVRVFHVRSGRGPKRENGVADYLKAAAENRAARASRAQQFAASGVTLGEVQRVLDPRSALDRAMRPRKPALGATRPAPRPIAP